MFLNISLLIIHSFTSSTSCFCHLIGQGDHHSSMRIKLTHQNSTERTYILGHVPTSTESTVDRKTSKTSQATNHLKCVPAVAIPFRVPWEQFMLSCEILAALRENVVKLSTGAAFIVVFLRSNLLFFLLSPHTYKLKPPL